MKPSTRFDILAALSLLVQLGLEAVLPPVGLTLLGAWLNSRYDIGIWLPITLLAIGLVLSCVSFYHFARLWLARFARPDEPPQITAEYEEKENKDEK